MKYKDVFFFRSLTSELSGSLKGVLASAFLLTGCAGPISPFGGVEVWSGDGQTFVFKTAPVPSTEFSFVPKRQVLHKQIDLTLKLKSKNNKVAQPNIKVTYNSKDVTSTFLKSASLQRQPGEKVQYIFNNLRLKPDRHHDIDVYWRNNDSDVYSRISYLPPVCPLSDEFSIVTTKPFRPRYEVMQAIRKIATEQQINPSLLAGLIAQESGFNPTRVSYAKAVGLTQITPIAEEEIKKLRPEWPSDPRVKELNFLEINSLISSKSLNRTLDWRLDPKYAVEGGALYLNYLISYWNSSENKILMNQNPNIAFTDVVLASYNSGPSRVKNKIKSDGEDWLNNSELKEAFKYVNNVVSYCYHFSETE